MDGDELAEANDLPLLFVEFTGARWLVLNWFLVVAGSAADATERVFNIGWY